MSRAAKWRIAGDWFDNCSCAIACPCTFGQAPDNNVCEHVLFWHIREGHFGGVKLNDLCIVLVGSFDGNLWDYDARGRSGIVIDARASDVQADAISEIFSGNAGGWPEKLGELFSRGKEFLGAERATISFEIAPDQSRWGVDIPGKLKAWAEALSGPTSTPGEPPRMSSPPGSERAPVRSSPGANQPSAKSMPLATISRGRSVRRNTYRLTGRTTNHLVIRSQPNPTSQISVDSYKQTK